MENNTHDFSTYLMALLSLGLVIMIAPRIFARNRGKILKNIALWVAIFLGLAFAYQTIGPGSKGPEALLNKDRPKLEQQEPTSVLEEEALQVRSSSAEP